MILALLRRDLNAILSDQGRIAELLVFPTSFLVIWGLLLYAGVIPHEVAAQLLVVNLIWTVSSQFQSQGNMCMMVDLWCREFAELFREGVGLGTFVGARVCFGTLIGVLSLMAFLLALPLFGGGWHEVRILLVSLPVYYLASIGLSFGVTGAVMYLGRSYAFLAWTALQVIVMFSSPYTPVSALPVPLRLLAYLSPYTFVFEFVRTGQLLFLAIGLVHALCFLVAGALFCTACFRRTRQGAGLASL